MDYMNYKVRGFAKEYAEVVLEQNLLLHPTVLLSQLNNIHKDGKRMAWTKREQEQ